MRQRGPPWARLYRAASRRAQESRSRRSRRPAGSAAKGSCQAGTSGAMSARESEGEKRVSSARAAVYSSRSRTRMTLLRPRASAAQARRQQDAMPLRCQCRASAGPESRERISAMTVRRKKQKRRHQRRRILGVGSKKAARRPPCGIFHLCCRGPCFKLPGGMRARASRAEWEHFPARTADGSRSA